MRKLLLCGALAAAALLTARPSQAYEGPWCAVINWGGGAVSENCAMPSFEVCRDEALRFGSTSFCRQNPAYPGYWSKGPAPRHGTRPKHRRHRH